MTLLKELVKLPVDNVKGFVCELLGATDAKITYNSESSGDERKAHSDANFGNVLQAHDKIYLTLTFEKSAEDRAEISAASENFALPESEEFEQQERPAEIAALGPRVTGFTPVPVSGPPVSETILANRR